MTDTEPTIKPNAIAALVEAGGGEVSWLIKHAAALERQRDETEDRDAELRWDLGNALGWELGDDPDVEDDTPTWAEIINGVKALRELSSVPVGSRRVPCICGEGGCTGTAMLSKSHDDPEAS